MLELTSTQESLTVAAKELICSAEAVHNPPDTASWASTVEPVTAVETRVELVMDTTPEKETLLDCIWTVLRLSSALAATEIAAVNVMYVSKREPRSPTLNVPEQWQ